MRKIILGKIYNTQTADKLGLYFSGEPDNTEELYRKRTGEFFLHVIGGKLSLNCQNEGIYRHGIDQIKPLSFDQAKKWAEKHLDTKDYQKNFGDIDEDEQRVTLCISCSKDERDIIKRNASEEGLSISKYIITRCVE